MQQLLAMLLADCLYLVKCAVLIDTHAGGPTAYIGSRHRSVGMVIAIARIRTILSPPKHNVHAAEQSEVPTVGSNTDGIKKNNDGSSFCTNCGLRRPPSVIHLTAASAATNCDR